MTTLAEALAPRSDQLNADDLIPGPRVLKITRARISKEERQTKIVLDYEGGDGKPWKPCKTMGRAMVMAWAITEEAQFVGKSVRVYRDPEVKFGDQGAVGGIRISHLSHIDKPATMKLTVSQGKKALFTFAPLVTDAPPAKKTPVQIASEWVEWYEAEVRDAPDMAALEQIHADAAPTLARIAKFPDLHARAVALSQPPSTSADEFRGEAHAVDAEVDQ